VSESARDVTKRVAVTVAVAVLGAAVVAQIALATHPRPRGATPVRVSLVPAYKQCTSPNTTHGAPLSFQSCKPPVQESNYLTVGTPDANGAPANSIGSALIKVKTTSPEEVLSSLSISDVRCKPGTAANVCNTPNTEDGPDYSGNLQLLAMVRISDHNNGPNQDEAATVQDIPFPVNVYCHNTADTSTGGLCNDPGPQCLGCFVSYDGQRIVAEITQIRIFDGGADGDVSSPGNTLFMTQGIFIP
jgi:hypothetical protein